MKTSFDFHEHISTKFVEALRKIQDSDIEAIADMFRSSVSNYFLFVFNIECKAIRCRLRFLS